MMLLNSPGGSTLQCGSGRDLWCQLLGLVRSIICEMLLSNFEDVAIWYRWSIEFSRKMASGCDLVQQRSCRLRAHYEEFLSMSVYFRYQSLRQPVTTILFTVTQLPEQLATSGGVRHGLGVSPQNAAQPPSPVSLKAFTFYIIGR